MKKIVVLLVVLFVFGMYQVAFGEATSGVNYTDPNFMTPILGYSLKHDHQYTLEKHKPELELGIIAEVILYRDEILNVPYSIGTESQYVWETGDWGLYGKVVIDLSPKIKELLGR